MNEKSNYKNVYLVGGYFVNPNYGDVIQAKVWVDYYNDKGLKVIFVYNGDKNKEAEFKYYLGKIDLVSYQNILDDNFKPENNSICHFYGGGYLNVMWGEVFLDIMYKFRTNDIEVIVGGVQVDKEWQESYLKKIGSSLRNGIHWLSVRDKISKSFVNNDRTIIGDDSFIYFSRNKNKLLKNHKASDDISKQIITHFNLSDYVLKNYNKETPNLYSKLKTLVRKNKVEINKYEIEKRREKEFKYLKEFLKNYSNLGYKFTTVQNFKDLPNGVMEAEGLFNDEISSFKVVDTFDLEVDENKYEFGVSNSFHAAIMMKLKFNIPVYFIALNQYYQQKSKGLIEYGIINKHELITSLQQLTKLKPSKKVFSENTKSWKNADLYTKTMEDRVDSILKQNY